MNALPILNILLSLSTFFFSISRVLNPCEKLTCPIKRNIKNSFCLIICVYLKLLPTVGASGVRDFETVSCQNRTEPSRLFIKHHFKTVNRQRRIGGG
jgi:hypothetical protein